MNRTIEIRNTGGIFFNKKDYMWVGLLFAYCINLLDIGWYAPLIFSPFLIAYLLKGKFSYSFITPLLLLICFNILYALFLYEYHYNTFTSIIGKVLYPIYFFVIGYMVVKGDEQNQYKKTYGYLLTLIISNVLFGVLCLIKTISLYGNMEIARFMAGRVVINIWGSNPIAATILNMSLAFGLSLLHSIFLSHKNIRHGKLIKLTVILSFIASVYCVVQLGNRTGILIIVCSYVVAFLLANKTGRRFGSVLFMIILGFFIKFLYNMNIFGIESAIKNTYFYARFLEQSLTEDPRISAWSIAFQGIFENPLGGKETKLPLISAHNMWLDVGYEAGIFPFLLLVVFTVVSIKTLVVFINLNHPIMLKSIIIGLYTSFFITFFMEPVLMGGVFYFTMFCFVFGIIVRLNSEKIQNNKL